VSDIDFLRRRIELHRNAVTVVPRPSSAPSSRERTGLWCCRRLSWMRWRRPPRVRTATSFCGHHSPVGIERRRQHASRGCRVRCPGARKQTSHSRG
jgi:hypothetical protein